MPGGLEIDGPDRTRRQQSSTWPRVQAGFEPVREPSSRVEGAHARQRSRPRGSVAARRRILRSPMPVPCAWIRLPRPCRPASRTRVAHHFALAVVERSLRAALVGAPPPPVEKRSKRRSTGIASPLPQALGDFASTHVLRDPSGLSAKSVVLRAVPCGCPATAEPPQQPARPEGLDAAPATRESGCG